MLIFTGENGLISDGLVAVSTDLLASIIESHGACLRLIVLNGCKTFDVAQAILLQCPTVDICICWMTPVHSDAATIFGTALAEMLAAERYLSDNDNLATVWKAFHGAKAAVLEQVQLGRLSNVGPIGTPLYAFLDPTNEITTYLECPCASRCQKCPCVPREIESCNPRKSGSDQRKHICYVAGGLAERSIQMRAQDKCHHLPQGSQSFSRDPLCEWVRWVRMVMTPQWTVPPARHAARRA